jgi:phage recombination protein Bet
MAKSKQIAKIRNLSITERDVDILYKAGVIPFNTPRPIVELFIRFCLEKNLSPFTKQVYLIPRYDSKNDEVRYITQISIDGLRTIADRTGRYAGSGEYLYDEGITLYEMLKAGRVKPLVATCSVYKILPTGQLFEVKASVRWEEFVPSERNDFMYRKMPFHMLGKVSEAFALRKAFPDCGGLYLQEELEGMEHLEPVEFTLDGQVIQKKENGEIEVIKPNVEIVKPEVVEIEKKKEKKATKKQVDEILKLAQNKLFELRKSDGINPDRHHIINKVTKGLNEKEANEIIDKLKTEINNNEERRKLLMDRIIDYCEKHIEDEEFGKKLLQVFPQLPPFPSVLEITSELMKVLVADDLQKIKEQLINGG